MAGLVALARWTPASVSFSGWLLPIFSEAFVAAPLTRISTPATVEVRATFAPSCRTATPAPAPLETVAALPENATDTICVNAAAST